MDRLAPAAPTDSRSQVSRPLEHLTPQERAVYHVLADNVGRVLSRSELARAAGLANLSERRCDSLIVGVRRAVGSSRVRTVRRRGWMLVSSSSAGGEAADAAAAGTGSSALNDGFSPLSNRQPARARHLLET